jgi:hypothetical protein
MNSDLNIIRMPKPPRLRYLRSYVRMADKDHGNCWQCEKPIMPGDEYEATVTIYIGEGRRVFYVRKEHYNCHDYPDDDLHVREDKEEREMLRTTERQVA